MRAPRRGLKHRALGYGKSDEEKRIELGWLGKASEWDDQVQVPGWALPCLCSTVFAAVALLAVYRASGLANPLAPWFILCIAALGFVWGCVAGWMGPPTTP